VVSSTTWACGGDSSVLPTSCSRQRSKRLGQGVVETNVLHRFFRLGTSRPLESDDQRSWGTGGWARRPTRRGMGKHGGGATA
jgi:hypothetical protein